MAEAGARREIIFLPDTEVMMRKRNRLIAALTLSAAITLACALPAWAVELKTGIGIVEADGLRLRAKPDTGAEILDNANCGDNVVIIRESGDFYLVDYNLQIGYMAKDYITFKERENIELGYANVAEASVNLRAKPDPNAELLAQLTPGDRPYIIGLNCGWYKVTFGELTGYIRSDLLELTEKPAGNSGGAADYVSQGQKVVDEAKKYLGYRYVWGGTTPSGGFDCSGYTRYVFAQLGYSIRRTAGQQLTNGTAVTELQKGDLVFFTNTYATSEAASHVGIYIGDNQFIHADGTSVSITAMDHPFYAARYIGARRIVS